MKYTFILPFSDTPDTYIQTEFYTQQAKFYHNFLTQNIMYPFHLRGIKNLIN